MQYGKDVTTLGVDSVLDELYWMRDFFDDCQKSGQGISSKESVYYRNLLQRLAVLDIDKANKFLDERN